MSRRWAHIPVNVRVVLIAKERLEVDGQVTNDPSQLEADRVEVAEVFDTARDWWLEQAGILLTLVGGEVELLQDNELVVPSSLSDPLDHLHQENSTWVTAVFLETDSGKHTITTAHGDQTIEYGGMAWFAQPGVGRRGYGCVVTGHYPKWATLAHELGHCFGLPHSTPGRDEGSGVEGTCGHSRTTRRRSPPRRTPPT